MVQFQRHFCEVEKNTVCNKLLVDHYPTTCVTKDVFNLLKTTPKAKTWKPHKLRLADDFECCTHKGRLLDKLGPFVLKQVEFLSSVSNSL